uniref:Uncharacterized protein n=1 Tax=Strigamia maritima TaxID=126957 RepID=T1JHN2_STRMM
MTFVRIDFLSGISSSSVSSSGPINWVSNERADISTARQLNVPLKRQLNVPSHKRAPNEPNFHSSFKPAQINLHIKEKNVNNNMYIPRKQRHVGKTEFNQISKTGHLFIFTACWKNRISAGKIESVPENRISAKTWLAVFVTQCIMVQQGLNDVTSSDC